MCMILIFTAPFVYAFDETWNGNASIYNATSQPQYIEYQIQNEYDDCDNDNTNSELKITQSRDTTGERTVEADGKTFTVLYPNEVAKLSARIVCSSSKHSGYLRFNYNIYDDYTNVNTLSSNYYLDGHFKKKKYRCGLQGEYFCYKYSFEYDDIDTNDDYGLSRIVKDDFYNSQYNIIPVSSMIMTIKNESDTDYYVPLSLLTVKK